MKKIIYILIFVLSSFCIFADFQFSINTTGQIYGSCTSDVYGGCPTGTECNLSSLYPNKTLYLNNVPMIIEGNFFFYEFNTTNLSQGSYLSTICCSFNSTSNCSTFNTVVYSLYKDTFVTNALSFQHCPENMDELIMFLIVIGFLLLLITLGFFMKIKWLIVFPSLFMFILSFSFTKCSAMLGLFIMIPFIILAVYGMMMPK